MIDSNTPSSPAGEPTGEAPESTSEPKNETYVQESEPVDAPAEDEPRREGDESEQRIASLEAALLEMEDRWKRSAAQLQNERRRFHAELDRVRRMEREEVLRSWLDVVDNLDRAVQIEGDRDNPWFEGMQAIRTQMSEVLRRFDVIEIEAVGATFDPERHEAIATANVPDQKEGSIIEVVQKGYRLDDRTLRHAKVIPVKHG